MDRNVSQNVEYSPSSVDKRQNTIIIHNPSILDRKKWWIEVALGYNNHTIKLLDSKDNIVKSEKLCYPMYDVISNIVKVENQWLMKCVLVVDHLVKSRSLDFLRMETK